MLQVEIEDDGRGFDSSLKPSLDSHHYGLVGMRERVEKVGGEFVPERQVPRRQGIRLSPTGHGEEMGNVPAPSTGSPDHLGPPPGLGRAVRTWDAESRRHKDGQPAVEVEVATTSEAAAIRLSVDREELTAARRDVAHVVVEILDDSGRLVPDADDGVTFTVRGEGADFVDASRLGNDLLIAASRVEVVPSASNRVLPPIADTPAGFT